MTGFEFFLTVVGVIALDLLCCCLCPSPPRVPRVETVTAVPVDEEVVTRPSTMNEFHELFALILPYMEAPGGGLPRKFRTTRPIIHGFTEKDLRFRIVRVAQLAHEIHAIDSISQWTGSQAEITSQSDLVRVEYRHTLAIVAEWLDELFKDIEVREEVKRAILFSGNVPKGYVLP